MLSRHQATHLALALALSLASACDRETVTCADFTSPVCADAFSGDIDAGPVDARVRDDANNDAFSVFDAPAPDAGNDAFIPDAFIVPDATMCNPACSGTRDICISAGVCGECRTDDDCGGANPACDTVAHTCVPCVNNTHCDSASAPACNVGTHTCVACVDNTTCTVALGGPICDVPRNACVGCLDAMTCLGNLDACVAQTCVGCDDRLDCMDDMGLPACVGNTCRQCDANTDCGSITSARCDLGMNTCARCMADTDCTRFGGTPVCDEGRGVCVQCTGDTEATRCGMNSCRRSDGTCTTQRRGLLGVCDSCEADSECSAGRRCVRHVFSGTDLGSFCFIDASMGGCGDTDTTRRPYRTRAPLTSIDGVAATYCMPPATTTCEGIRDTQNQICSASTECGDSRVADGFCPSTGTGAGVCTYECSGGFDCRSTLNCGDTPAHCRP